MKICTDGADENPQLNAIGVEINDDNPGFRDVSAAEREYYENLIRKSFVICTEMRN